MNIRITTIALALLLAGMVIVIPVLHTTAAAQTGQPNDGLTPIQKRLLSGFASLQLDQENGSDPQSANTYFPRGSGDCTLVNSSNVKVNQDCLNLSDPDLQGRGQAQNETSIAQNPNQPNHIVASYNDYRRGDGTCGVSWSTDKGRTWNDSTVPNNFVRGQRTSGGHASIIKLVAIRRSRGIPKGMRISPVRCSSADPPSPAIQISRMVSTFSAPRRTLARPLISRRDRCSRTRPAQGCQSPTNNS